MPKYEFGGQLRIDYRADPSVWDEMAQVDLRNAAMVALFDARTLETRLELAQVLGFSDYRSLRDAHALEVGLVGPISDKLRLLSGEHGYAIYKAMLARLEK